MNSSQQLIAPLACMATGLTFFLGFMPVSRVPSQFIGLHSAIAGFLWFVVFIQAQNVIYLILAAACALAWHNFRVDNTPAGKMLLALVSGLAVGFGLFRSGLMPIPPYLPPAWSSFWMLSILFSSAVLGSCYLALMTGGDYEKKSITRETFERNLHIFLTCLALRGILFVAILAAIFFGQENVGLRQQWFTYDQMGSQVLFRVLLGLILPLLITLWGLALLRSAPSKFKFAPFYVLVFLVLWGEIYALKIGF